MKNLDQFLTLSLDQFLTLKPQILDQFLTLQHIYIVKLLIGPSWVFLMVINWSK